MDSPGVSGNWGTRCSGSSKDSAAANATLQLHRNFLPILFNLKKMCSASLSNPKLSPKPQHRNGRSQLPCGGLLQAPLIKVHSSHVILPEKLFPQISWLLYQLNPILCSNVLAPNSFLYFILQNAVAETVI